ncbi:sugar porter family MFS transporter [Clostridium algoriphilum]|uniref:sugar porter family MFS transporter n=1 Tax=Clostridium algoriphilum TaxID=198347 RepID=UPI001CF15B79|nr:sugar porter family MFS transporter [Clostridium algoriphilum]MCB2294951.1 sugar porter family MFS transporter [Clostridium algoriphilum]
MSEKHKKNRSLLFIILISCAAGLGGLLYGYDTAVISGAIGSLQKLYNLTPMMEGLVISSIMIGGVAGVGISGFLGDFIGRKKVLMFAAALFGVSALASALSHSVEALIIARIIGGLGIGMASALSVTYITECAPPAIRGRLSALYQLFTISGMCLTYFINLWIVNMGSEAWLTTTGWRWMLACGIFPSVVFLLTLFFVPESPRYLVKAGKLKQASAVLNKINGPIIGKQEFDSISNSLVVEKNSTLKQLFKPGLRKALVIGIFLAIFNQAVGMNSITYYGPKIFEMIGFKTNSSFLATSVVGVVDVIATVLAMFLIDKVGRKKLMAIGSALMAFFMLFIGLAFYTHYANGMVILFLILGFVASFCISMGPIPWIMIPEIFPNYLRARATGIATMFLWGANWAIGQFTPMLLSSIGGAFTFWIFCGLNVICFIFVTTMVPETKNKSLEEIEKFWIPKNIKKVNAKV